MGTVELGYGTFGLTKLDFLAAIGGFMRAEHVSHRRSTVAATDSIEIELHSAIPAASDRPF